MSLKPGYMSRQLLSRLAMRTLTRFCLASVILTLISGAAQAQVGQYSYSISNYWNRVYSPVPAPIAGCSITQTPAVMFFSGSVGPLGSPAKVPTDGQFQLVRASFGHAMGPVSPPDFLLGEPIVPNSTLAVDMGQAPAQIDPPQRAFYVPELQQLIACEPGYVKVSWQRTNHTATGPVQYLISQQPIRPAVAIYHTHNPGASLTNAVQTLAPMVDLSGIPQVVFHWNLAVPDRSSDPYLQRVGNQLYAKEAKGLIVLEYRKDGHFLDYEIVEVRSDTAADTGTTLVSLGGRLLPAVIFQESVKPMVSKGLSPSNPTVALVYQHERTESAQYGQLWAIRKTLTENDVEVFWRRKGVQGVEWPYELHRYTARWPTDAANYQIYIRGSKGEPGLAVTIPATISATTMPFQEPASHAKEVTQGKFSTLGAGWSLLKYEQGSSVAFQVVRSVLNNDATVPGLVSSTTWEIGQEITEPQHEGPVKSGYIYAPEGDRYDWETYEGTENDPPGWDAAWTTKQIFAVNLGILEVWWSRMNQGVQWPCFAKRYNCVWPSAPEQLVIASQVGLTIRPEEQAARLYVQNDPTGPGFNPNDEHAFTVATEAGRVVYALRDDLGTAQTSEPYLLLKYQDATNNSLWRFRVCRVTAETPQQRFSYAGLAANEISAPVPVAKDKGPNMLSWEKDYGVSGPYWKDRRKRLWAIAAGNDGGTTNVVVRYYYPTQKDFFFPDTYFAHFPVEVTRTNLVMEGTLFPWLDLHAGTPTVPQDISYQIEWRHEIELDLGQTLVAGTGQKGSAYLLARSVDILYQQSLALNRGQSVKLFSPMLWVTVTNVPETLFPLTDKEANRQVFPTLPSSLRPRLWFDLLGHSLTLGGDLFDNSDEPLVFLNAVSSRDLGTLLSASQLPDYQQTVQRLANQAQTIHEILPDQPFENGDLALTAGTSTGFGYVTLALNNSTNLVPISEWDTPVQMVVIKVLPQLHTGSVKVIKRPSDSPLADKLTLRFNGDMAGSVDDYEFQWQYSENGNAPDDDWNSFPVKPRVQAQPGEPAGCGAVEITVEGPGPLTLGDHYFRCRYRPLSAQHPLGTNVWSAWTGSRLAEGWIKRALAGLTICEPRYQDLRTGVDTRVSAVAVAGAPWNGTVPFNREAVERAGLIQLYGTIMRRGIDLSLTGTPSLPYDPVGNANIYQALLLAASRYADLYMLVGNEAFADASDPTIGIGTGFNRSSSAMFCFQNQAEVPSLLAEELTLLRGRGATAKGTSLTNYPVYNRLYWNFTRGNGQIAYVNNYDIRLHGTNRTSFTAEDAEIEFPQGHGDAWGHYLTAIKGYFDLLRATNFAWFTTNESISIPNLPDQVVNYFYERQFAAAALAKARTGLETVKLTYREQYLEDPSRQCLGYPDSDSDRAWGVADWGSRAGQGAFFDWVVANAILPPDSAPTEGVRVDRTTVTELRELATTFQSIEQQIANMDAGLNPLGLPKNVIPFALDEQALANKKTHFEQIYDRALQAMNNAIAVFNYANEATQMLRQRAKDDTEFQTRIAKQEQDYTSRLIEIFGTPYDDDCRPGGTYPTGYSGPDTENFHFLINDPSELVGSASTTPITVSLTLRKPVVQSDASLAYTETNVTLLVSADGFGLAKPSTWGGKRTAPGEIQRTFHDLATARGRFSQALTNYDNLLLQIEDQASLLRAQLIANATELQILYGGQGVQESLNQAIKRARDRQMTFRALDRMAILVGNALAEAFPKSVGFATDPSGPMRHAVLIAGSIRSEMLTQNADRESMAELDYQQAKEIAQSANNITLTGLRQTNAVVQQKEQLEQLLRDEPSRRLEIYVAQEGLQQAVENYRASIAKGQRLLDERQRFRQQTAGDVQSYRYHDLAFRIFRNDALQKYRAQFDLAAMYVYLAAKAYDYETCLLPADKRAGQQFLESIVRKRAIGEIKDGQPLQGTGEQDPGLADPLKTLADNFAVLKPDLGLNDSVTRERLFSLRSGKFRIDTSDTDPGAVKLANATWRQVLEQSRIQNILDIPEVRKYCRAPRPESPLVQEPGIVIEFHSMIYAEKNFFGWPAGPGDNNYNSTYFSAKIRTVGLWFSNYDSTKQGLMQNPYAYLLPVGLDVLRTPYSDQSELREWQVVDQKIPVPFDFGQSARYLSEGWIPFRNGDGLTDTFEQVRQFSALDATTDRPGQTLDTSKIVTTSRLVGRSVWNTRWMLIIPGVFLYGDNPAEGIERFIHGRLVNGKRDENGVTDIKLYFQTYHYSGN